VENGFLPPFPLPHARWVASSLGVVRKGDFPVRRSTGQALWWLTERCRSWSSSAAPFLFFPPHFPIFTLISALVAGSRDASTRRCTYGKRVTGSESRDEDIKKRLRRLGVPIPFFSSFFS